MWVCLVSGYTRLESVKYFCQTKGKKCRMLVNSRATIKLCDFHLWIHNISKKTLNISALIHSHKSLQIKSEAVFLHYSSFFSWCIFTCHMGQGHHTVMNLILVFKFGSISHILTFGYAVKEWDIFHCQNLKSISSTVTYWQSTPLLVAKLKSTLCGCIWLRAILWHFYWKVFERCRNSRSTINIMCFDFPISR